MPLEVGRVERAAQSRVFLRDADQQPRAAQAVEAPGCQTRAAGEQASDDVTKLGVALQQKQKALQDMQTKLQQGGSVLNDQARGQLEKDIEKAQRDIQFFQQDAQSEIQELQNRLQGEFQQKLNPILEQVATEKGLHMLFSIADSGAIWANTGLDLSAEVIKRFDAASKTPATDKE